MKKGALIVDNGYIGFRLPKLLLENEEIFKTFIELNKTLNETGPSNSKAIHELILLANKHIEYLISNAILGSEEIDYLVNSEASATLFDNLDAEVQNIMKQEKISDNQVMILYAYNFIYALTAMLVIDRRNTIKNDNMKNQLIAMNFNQIKNIKHIVDSIFEKKVKEIQYDAINKVDSIAIFGIRISLDAQLVNNIIKDPYYIAEITKLMKTNKGYLITDQPDGFVFIPYKVLKAMAKVKSNSIVLIKFFEELESRGFENGYIK